MFLKYSLSLRINLKNVPLQDDLLNLKCVPDMEIGLKIYIIYEIEQIYI